MRLWNKIEVMYFVWLAEQRSRSGMDCSYGMITYFRNYDQFSDYAERYEKLLPDGWELGYEKTKVISRIGRRLGTQSVYVLVFFDPARCESFAS